MGLLRLLLLGAVVGFGRSRAWARSTGASLMPPNVWSKAEPHGITEGPRPRSRRSDTFIFIYFIEEHPRFLPAIEPRFQEVDQGRIELVTSTLTLLEVLAVPCRRADHLLATLNDIDSYAQPWSKHGRQSRAIICEPAAQLKATTGLKTPDSRQLVAALAGRCTVFITNNRGLPAVPGFRILQLASYVLA